MPGKSFIADKPSLFVWRMNSRLQRHKVRLRGLGIESAEADFVLFQQRFQPPRKK